MSTPTSISRVSDLNAVMAAVGPQVFSYLPIGSLLGGRHSPTLVNTVFHDGIFQWLGQCETLCLSSCKHLRGVTDEGLVRLVRKIVDACEASSPASPKGPLPGESRPRARRHACSGTGNCECTIKVKCLDLSRCRNVKNEGVYFCLRHMPLIERVIVSSATRFGTFGSDSVVKLDKLHYIDVSGCSRIGSNDIKNLLSVTLTCSRVSIRHLDLSGCSALIDDNAAYPLALCPNLQVLSMAGSKVTAHGVGILCYVHRNNLRCLNLRGCEEVQLPLMLGSAAFEISRIIGEGGDNIRSLLPPNPLAPIAPVSEYSYCAELKNAMAKMVLSHGADGMEHLFDFSTNYMRMLKEFDETHGHSQQEGRMLGQLRKLDIGMIGNTRVRIEGCVALIAWLNGGHLREIDLCGLERVCDADLSVLAMSSPGQLLQALNVSTTLSYNRIADEASVGRFLQYSLSISELDLSYCNIFDGNDSYALRFLCNLRTLNLNNTTVPRRGLTLVLEASSQQLLRLSVCGCSNLSSSSIVALQGENDDPGLLELDCRSISMDTSLSELRSWFPSLLKLNNRSTALGIRHLKSHRRDFLWRVGERQSNIGAKKRKKSGDANTINISGPAADSREFSFTNSCSLLRTGFRQSSDTEQEMFCCMTCGIHFERFVCLACSTRCHQGHDVISVGYGIGCCDCCILSPCKCLNRD